MQTDHQSQGSQDPRPRVRAYFSLFGETFDPELCTELLGMAPTASGRRGETPRGRRHPYAETFWEILLDRRAYDLDEVLSDLLAMLMPRKQAIQNVRGRGGVGAEVSCAVDLYVENIVLGVSEASIGALAELHLGLGLDLFDYREAAQP